VRIYCLTPHPNYLLFGHICGEASGHLPRIDTGIESRIGRAQRSGVQSTPFRSSVPDDSPIRRPVIQTVCSQNRVAGWAVRGRKYRVARPRITISIQPLSEDPEDYLPLVPGALTASPAALSADSRCHEEFWPMLGCAGQHGATSSRRARSKPYHRERPRDSVPGASGRVVLAIRILQTCKN